MFQHEFEKRKGKVVCSGNIFSGKIICGDCGGFYGSKVWNSNDKYRKVICLCNDKYKHGTRCQTPTCGTQVQLNQEEYNMQYENLREQYEKIMRNSIN